MKIYMWCVAIVLLFMSVVGFILPALFSAKQNEAVLLGIFILIAFPVIIFWMINKITKGRIKNEEV